MVHRVQLSNINNYHLACLKETAFTLPVVGLNPLPKSAGAPTIQGGVSFRNALPWFLDDRTLVSGSASVSESPYSRAVGGQKHSILFVICLMSKEVDNVFETILLVSNKICLWEWY